MADAAIVATASLAWQVYAWRHRRRSHVTVTCSLGIPVGLDRDDYLATITAANRSEHPIRVEGVGLDTQDGSKREIPMIDQFSGNTIPGVIAPHDSGSGHFWRSQVESEVFSVYEPVTGWVRLATGEVIRSKAKRLMTR